MGQVAARWGIQRLPIFILVEFVVMLILFAFVINNIRASRKQNVILT